MIIVIVNYEIRNIKGEEILYIFINDSYEFAKLNKGKKRKNFLKMIGNFIKDNEIKFAGSTIALVAGGLVIGNLFFNKTDDISLKNCIVSLHLNPQVVESEIVNDEFLNKTSVNKVIEDIIINDKKNVSKKEISKVSEKKEVEIKTEKSIKQEIKESVTVFRTNGEVLTLEMEEYLINVVAAEMPASFNEEALKAQSVLARTYARKTIRNGKVLTDSVSTQLYKDINELKKLWGNDYNAYYNKIKNAVMSTNSEVLKYNGDYIEAVYHSTSNGYTEDASNVWGNSFPYLKVVKSDLDKQVKNYEFTTFFSYSKLSKLLEMTVDNETDFHIVDRNESLRVSQIIIGNNSYSGVDLRTKLNLRSTDFDFEKTTGGVNIITRGYGHGVGMSQYGANELAKSGLSYKQILNHYYSGTSLVKE